MKKYLTAAVLALSFAGVAAADDSGIDDVYKAKCKGCHGEDGKARTKVGIKEKVKDMTSAEWQAKQTDADIKSVIADGSKDNKKMKPFKEKLSAEEVEGLIRHIRGFKS